jgi:hypothetical protein
MDTFYGHGIVNGSLLISNLRHPSNAGRDNANGVIKAWKLDGTDNIVKDVMALDLYDLPNEPFVCLKDRVVVSRVQERKWVIDIWKW